MLIFAYGSNMHQLRLRQRVPSCRSVATGQLSGYRLVFNKRGNDGSAKANAFHTGRESDRLVGVIYDIDPAEKPVLDKIESLGCGYEEKYDRIKTIDGQRHLIPFYVAMPGWIENDLLPFDWYHRYVLMGAIENKLLPDYIDFIKGIKTLRDPEQNRRDAHLRILGQKGIPFVHF
jgi:gamma-glutamylcyclotransferase (GGCT)/AIG2-like uncharacterized protein YtfP